MKSIKDQKMVAIALYKGYLRRHPDVPRKWIMPARQISFKDFKNLRRRRSESLSRVTSAFATTSNNPSPNHEPECKISVVSKDGERQIGGEGGKCLENGEDATIYPLVVEENPAVDDQIGDVVTEKNLTVDNTVAEVVVDEKEMDEKGNADAVYPPTEQTSKNEDCITDKDKRKKELEEKLHLLNEKKHGLVQALKQILNAEEELKKRNCPQGAAGRTSVPLHLDIPKDTVSVTRLSTPRLGLDRILAGEVEGAEPEGSSYPNVDTRPLILANNASPSDSQTKKLSSIYTIPHLVRTTSGVSGSPSRFAPSGQQQGHLHCVSVSGTNYIASSPSPAASGGTTSAFRG